MALVRHSSRCSHICLHRGRIAIIDVCLAAVDQVQIGHGVVVVGPVGHCLVQILQALIHQRGILCLERLHHLLGRLHIALAIVVDAGRLQAP